MVYLLNTILYQKEMCEFYTEGNFTLAKGRYIEVQKFKVTSIQHPPLEDPDDTRKELGHFDFLEISYSLDDERNNIIPPKFLDTQESLEIQVTKTLLQQSHLCPFTLSMTSIYGDYDHTLRLYPIPDVLILADIYKDYSIDIPTSGSTYNLENSEIKNCYCFNQSGFSSNEYKWIVYWPWSRKSELCEEIK
ncbi:4930_t:CDS:2 [Scutellospora calospora]|uniref:4930_t:CDS:1 n=1 Tax=Scutellospora calospora TaxID=85575 RepID=A0ACA9L1V8_9GLOM|nr:4930_t:CDS:2 [Scutellospora calospora]